MKNQKSRILLFGLIALLFQVFPFIYDYITSFAKGTGNLLGRGDTLILMVICFPIGFVLPLISIFQVKEKSRIYGFDKWDAIALMLAWTVPVIILGVYLWINVC